MEIKEIQQQLLAMLPIWNHWFVRPFKHLLDKGVSLDMYYCIQTLRFFGRSMTMSELARYLHMPKQQMTKLVNQLVTCQFVERVRSPEDRRTVRIELTDAALNYIDQFLDEDASCFRSLLECMDPKDRQLLSHAIRDILDVLSRLPDTGILSSLTLVRLRDRPDLAAQASEWLSAKWGVAQQEYQRSISACIRSKSAVPQWYVLLTPQKTIAAGAGVIENDFHDRKDLTPNLCALYVEPAYRKSGVARFLLNAIRADLARQGCEELYLVTDHTDFYEKCGWDFLTVAQSDDGKPIRVYAAKTRRPSPSAP